MVFMMLYWKSIPPLKTLLAVEATARLRSFTRAGEELNTSQSAVSHAVTQAEEFLDVKLFDRSARPIVVTPEGSDYVASLSLCLAQLASDAQAVRQRRQENVLTISCNLAYGNYWLLPRLKSFHEAFPDIQVNMVTTFHGLAAFDSGIDVAIRFGRGTWPDCQSHLLFREQILPVAAPSYTSKAPAIVKPSDLLHHTLLHAKAMDRSWYDWNQWFHHFGVIPGNGLAGPTFDNHLLMMQAALSGRGVAMGWIGTAAEFLRDGQLRPLLHTPVVLEDGLFAVVRNRRDPRVNNFLDWIIDYSRTDFENAVKQYWG